MQYHGILKFASELSNLGDPQSIWGGTYLPHKYTVTLLFHVTCNATCIALLRVGDKRSSLFLKSLSKFYNII
jgi:hypothetical protein